MDKYATRKANKYAIGDTLEYIRPKLALKRRKRNNKKQRRSIFKRQTKQMKGVHSDE